MLELHSDRFHAQTGTRIQVQVPQEAAVGMLQAVPQHEGLAWSDSDRVDLTAAKGGDTPERGDCCDGRCGHSALCWAAAVCEQDGRDLQPVVRATYQTHPCEEQVVQLVPAVRKLHIRGQNDNNPDPFRNRKTPGWVPAEHRR